MFLKFCQIPNFCEQENPRKISNMIFVARASATPTTDQVPTPIFVLGIPILGHDHGFPVWSSLFGWCLWLCSWTKENSYLVRPWNSFFNRVWGRVYITPNVVWMIITTLFIFYLKSRICLSKLIKKKPSFHNFYNIYLIIFITRYSYALYVNDCYTFIF